MTEVVARSPARRGLLLALLVINVLQLALWVTRALREDDPVATLLAVALAVLVVGLAVSVLLTRRPAELVLTEDALTLRRRRRPLTVARASIRAVRGDVRGRPTWSHTVVLHLDDRTLRLPALEPGAGVLVPRLQTWAGVGEDPEERLG
ncbi:hypothetical protein [Cellulomonas cellasea]|uniref:PH domain-containing protein n=1 Tax=Cellulomonas cellasea TaxID=43670 RepID=A0A7W4YDC3_9CELL|nr:hypothetical protein [Cellulomonas cellasea]MBB2924401.1 hypothetical protein [Cellulomonas cellasea]